MFERQRTLKAGLNSEMVCSVRFLDVPLMWVSIHRNSLR